MIDAQERRRLFVFATLMALAGIAIAGRYAFVMVVAPSPDGEAPVTLPEVERGPILDRNGRVLAISTRLDSVAAWIPDITNPEATAERLAPLVEVDAGTLFARLESGSRFVFVDRKVTPSTSERVREAIVAGELPGISLVPEYARSYPEQELASHVLGFVGVDNVGLAGIENTFNHVLSPALIERGIDKVHGNQVFLSVDVNVQFAADRIAADAYEEHRADAVVMLVMDATTGDILAYSSVPTFDPNTFDLAPPSDRVNRPVATGYEPGSVFKVFSMASLLETGAIDTDDSFICPGHYERILADGTVIRINDLGVHGEVDVADILKYSCNAGAAFASDRIGSEALHHTLETFGFGTPTGIPFAGESAGLLRDPDGWSVRSKPTIAIGQEILVSAVQVATAATALANDGLLLEPRIVSKVVAPDGSLVKQFGRSPIREVLDPDVARNVLGLMEGATGDGGTARRARIPGLRISAKTGTAQVTDPVTGAYSDENFTASFLGIFPTDAPRYIVYTVIHHPRGESQYGGVIAAPVFRRMAEFLISYGQVPVDGQRLIAQRGAVRIELPPALSATDRVPDLTGTSKRLLLSLLDDERIRLDINGIGYVVAQDPPAGTPIEDLVTISVELE